MRYIHPVMLAASSRVLRFCCHGNGVLDINLILTLKVQSAGNSSLDFDSDLLS